MLASVLNKGFRGAILWLAGLLLVSASLSAFAFRDLESSSFPNLFYNYFANKVSSRSMIVLINYLVIASGVLLVSLIAGRQEILEKSNYYPVFIYLIICLAAIQPSQLSARATANLFVLYAFYRLLDSYREEEAMNKIFEAGFLTSLSAFASISSIVNFPLLFIALLILRPFHWREWVVAFIGFLSPVFIYECVAYLADLNQWYFIKAGIGFFSYATAPRISEYYLPILFLLGILLIAAITGSVIGGFGNTVKKQKAKVILLWFIFLNALGFLSEFTNASKILLTLSLPLSFFIGDMLYNIRQQKITNTILVLLFFCLMLIFAAEYEFI